MEQGCNLNDNKNALTLEKGSFNMHSCWRINSRNGMLIQVTMLYKTLDISIPAMLEEDKIKYLELCKCLSHTGKVKVKATAKHMNWTIMNQAKIQRVHHYQGQPNKCLQGDHTDN